MFGRREWKTGYGRDIVVVVVDAKKENEKIYNNSQIIFRFVIINIKRESKRVRTEGKFLLALTLFNPASLTFEVFDV